jgi:6-phosphogluconolactonase
MKKLNLSIIINVLILVMIFASSCNSQPQRLFAGKYTKEGEKGLYLFDLNSKDGTFKLLTEADAGTNPSYFCISEKSGMIYAINEISRVDGLRAGSVTALSYDSKSGAIEKVASMAVPNGGPCYISLSHNEDYLFMANYSGGSVAVIRLDEKGLPSAITDTIFFEGDEGKRSRAHMIAPGPSGKRVYLTDLGLDRVVIYDFDPVSGRLNQIPDGIVNFPEGAGPRHFAINSTETKMYVINELNSTMSVFDMNSDGGLKLLQTISTLREGYSEKSYCADVHIGRSGEFLYGSNRGENTIVTFRIAGDGTLSVVGHTTCGGDWPRNFVIDPSGENLLVGNQRSGNISLFRIDKKTGMPLEPAKDFAIETPACLKF